MQVNSKNYERAEIKTNLFCIKMKPPYGKTSIKFDRTKFVGVLKENQLPEQSISYVLSNNFIFTVTFQPFYFMLALKNLQKLCSHFLS